MKLLKPVMVVTALAALGGCVAVPVGPGYYSSGPGYYAAEPAYYPPPVYYGPSVEIGVHRGWHGGRHYRYR
jgi:hypothetical protein